MSLINLPSEILQEIAAIVHDTHRPSLSSFMLACKACYSASNPSLFRHIRIDRKPTRKLLSDDVQEWLRLLKARQSLAHVRSIEVYSQRRMYPLVNRGDENDDQVEEDDASEAEEEGKVDVGGDSYWLPVRDLLRELTCPTDIIWDVTDPFPPALLHAVQNHQSHCRLHLKQFTFRSLLRKVTDKKDLALVTSPHLHSLHVMYCGRYSSGVDDHHFEAGCRVLEGLAPNLKRFSMVFRHAPSSAQLYRTRGIPRKPWKGFTGVKDEDARRGRVEVLVLGGETRLSETVLGAWARRTDFSLIRDLHLLAYMTGDCLRWASTNISLPSLRHLKINLDRDDEYTQRPNFSENAKSFFETLGPLQTLHLCGALEQDILHLVLKKQGGTLEELFIRPFESMYSKERSNNPLVLTQDDLTLLQKTCPNVKKLTLPIKRIKGSAAEVAMYRTLGQMRGLTELFITLDCSNPWARQTTLPERTQTVRWDEASMELNQMFADAGLRENEPAYIRDAYINSAADEKLAMTIWHIISDDKAGRPLESLQAKTSGGFDFGTNGYNAAFMTIIEHLSRCYKITKAIAEGDETTTVVEENKRIREERDEGERRRIRDWKQGGVKVPEPSVYERIFSTIWPKKEGSEDWRDDWESFPLCVDAAEAD